MRKVCLILILFFSESVLTQTRTEEIVYPIYSGRLLRLPMETVYIEPANLEDFLRPGETVVGKNCILEIDGSFSGFDVYLFPDPGGPQIRTFGFNAEAQIFSVTNGNEFPCSGIAEYMEDVLVPAFPDRSDFTISGIGRNSGAFESLDEPSGLYQVNYQLVSRGTSEPSSPAPTFGAGFEGFGTVAFIVEYVIEGEELQDARINEVQLAQTVFDPGEDEFNKISIVTGKPFDVKVSGDLENSDFGDPLEVKAEILNSGTVIAEVTEVFTADSSKKIKGFIPLPDNIPVGDYSLRITADPNDLIEEESENNNVAQIIPFQVLNTFPLGVGVIGLNGCDRPTPCYDDLDAGAVDRFSNDSVEDLMADLFPVSRENAIISEIPFELVGDPNNEEFELFGEFRFTRGLINDFIQLERYIYLDVVQPKRKIVGIVPSGYFIFHKEDEVPGPGVDPVLGIAMVPFERGFGGNVAFVREDADPGVFFHEIGHLFGGDHEESLVDGFDNLNQTEVIQNTNLMSENSPLLPEEYWISNPIYGKAFRSLTSNLIDPEIVVVSGVFDLGENTFESFRTEKFEQGFLTPQDNSRDLAFEALDQDGAILSSNSISSRKRFYIDRESGSFEIEPSKVPFVISIPDSAGLFLIQVSKNGEIIYEQSTISSFEELARLIRKGDLKVRSDKLKSIVTKFMVKLGIKIDWLKKRGKIRAARKLARLFLRKVHFLMRRSNSKSNIIKVGNQLQDSI